MARNRRNKRRGANARRRPIRRRRSKVKVANIRPRAIRTSQSGTPLIIKAFRFFQTYVTQFDFSKEYPTIVSSWLDRLSWFGSLALKLLTIAIATSDKNSVLLYASGGFGAWDFTIGDLLIDTPLTFDTNNRGFKQVGYRQARINWIRCNILPSVEVANRGGNVAIAFYSLGLFSGADDMSSQDKILNASYEAILTLPNAKEFSASRPIYLTYVPSDNDMNVWYDLGTASYREEDLNNLQARAIVRLVIGMRDFSLTDNQSSMSAYALNIMNFEVQLQAEILLRNPGKGYVRTKPLSIVDTTSIGVWAYGESDTVKLDKITALGGLKDKISDRLIDSKAVIGSVKIPELKNCGKIFNLYHGSSESIDDFEMLSN